MDETDKALGKIFKKKEEPEIIPEKERETYIGKDNCIALIPKTTDMLNRIKRFDVTINPKPLGLNYHPKAYEPQETKINIDYLKTAVQLIAQTKSEQCELKLNRNYPVTLATDELDIVIAPRVDGEEYGPTIEGETDVEKSLHLFLLVLKSDGVDKRAILDIKKYITTRLI